MRKVGKGKIKIAKITCHKMVITQDAHCIFSKRRNKSDSKLFSSLTPEG